MGIHIFCAAALALTTPTMESDMSFHRPHFEELIRETLDQHGLGGDAAVNLLLGTAAVESNFGTFLKQLHRGPAVGVFQMEPDTYDWLVEKYFTLHNRECCDCGADGVEWEMRKRGSSVRIHWPAQTVDEMVWDLKLAILMARLRYLVVPEPLPPADDIDALGRYWKSYYYTFAGAGSVRGWLEAWDEYVAQ